MLINKNIYGIYNISSNNKISKYDFGLKLAKIFNLKNTNIIKHNFNNCKFINRPKNMSLENKKILKKIKFLKKKLDIDNQIMEFKKYYYKK